MENIPVYERPEYSKRIVQKALDGDLRVLNYAFYWNDTPQGSSGWMDVYPGRRPLSEEEESYLRWLIREPWTKKSLSGVGYSFYDTRAYPGEENWNSL